MASHIIKPNFPTIFTEIFFRTTCTWCATTTTGSGTKRPATTPPSTLGAALSQSYPPHFLIFDVTWLLISGPPSQQRIKPSMWSTPLSTCSRREQCKWRCFWWRWWWWRWWWWWWWWLWWWWWWWWWRWLYLPWPRLHSQAREDRPWCSPLRPSILPPQPKLKQVS